MDSSSDNSSLGMDSWFQCIEIGRHSSCQTHPVNKFVINIVHQCNFPSQNCQVHSILAMKIVFNLLQTLFFFLNFLSHPKVNEFYPPSFFMSQDLNILQFIVKNNDNLTNPLSSKVLSFSVQTLEKLLSRLSVDWNSEGVS